MDAVYRPNFLLEALSYLGSRANGSSISQLEKKLLKRGVQISDEFRRQSEPLIHLTQLIDQKVIISDSQLHYLFGNLDGFPHDTIGSHSPAFLLLYPVLNLFKDDPDDLITHVLAMSPELIARNLLISLDMDDLTGPECDGSVAQLTDSILSLDIPAESRLTLLEIHRNYPAILREAGSYIKLVLSVFEQNDHLLNEMYTHFYQDMERMGSAAYLHETSSLDANASECYHLHPLLLGPDTNISLVPSESGNGTDIYCGVLRLLLRRLLSSAEDDINQVYEMIRLLGDKTRFSILCYLNGHSAYGLELSEHFNLARNTIHHHMNKLLNADLVICTVSGNRVYYETNREKLENLLACQQRLLTQPQEK